MSRKEQNAKIAQEMRQHVVSLQNGKMSLREYCDANGMAEHKLSTG